jgi:hypothetical protein
LEQVDAGVMRRMVEQHEIDLIAKEKIACLLLVFFDDDMAVSYRGNEALVVGLSTCIYE